MRMHDSPTSIDEIADSIYRISTYTDDIPGGFTFNQFLVAGEDPLLFHTGPRQLFPSVSATVERLMPVERLRWISFGHWEADESGAINSWLDASNQAEVAVGILGAMISGADQCDRPPLAPLDDGHVLDLGGKRMRWIDTPHVPHGWDAGLWFEETTNTLFCGDLFTAGGKATVLTQDDIVGPALAAEDLFQFTCLTPRTAPTIRRLAALQPTTLALMHGPSFTGDSAAALRDLADSYQTRLHEALDASQRPRKDDEEYPTGSHPQPMSGDGHRARRPGPRHPTGPSALGGSGECGLVVQPGPAGRGRAHRRWPPVARRRPKPTTTAAAARVETITSADVRWCGHGCQTASACGGDASRMGTLWRIGSRAGR